MRMARFYVGSFLIRIGIAAMPPGRVRSELYRLIDDWTTHVHETLAGGKK
jgi:hypothetical protein